MTFKLVLGYGLAGIINFWLMIFDQNRENSLQGMLLKIFSAQPNLDQIHGYNRRMFDEKGINFIPGWVISIKNHFPVITYKYDQLAQPER